MRVRTLVALPIVGLVLGVAIAIGIHYGRHRYPCGNAVSSSYPGIVRCEQTPWLPALWIAPGVGLMLGGLVSATAAQSPRSREARVGA